MKSANLQLTLLLAALTLAHAACPPGTVENGTACVDCPPGTYQAHGTTTCTKCEAGRFNPFAGAQGEDLCRRCPSGTFSNAGAAKCTVCPPGTASEEFSPRCLACGPGSEVRFRSCGKCSRGFYSTGSSNLECTSCPSGFTTRGQGATSPAQCVKIPPPACVINNKPRCGNCDRGEFFDSDTLDCQFCPKGTFSRKRGSRACTPCPKGTFAQFSGSDRCRKCRPGSSSIAGSHICKIDGAPCPINYFKDAAGRCVTCDRGFRRDVGSKSCKPCPEGTFSKGGAPTKCRRCQSGAVFVPDLHDCLCMPGRVLTLDGRCKLCPRGTKRDSERAGPLCELCFRGSFSNNVGSAECTDCPDGTFQDKEGQTSCKPCPAGTFPKPIANDVCLSGRTNCPLGYKRVERPSRPFNCELDVCPPGTFKREGSNGLPECGRCFPGQRFVPSKKQCVQCGLQEISEGGLVTECTPCPNGLFRYRPEGNRCRCIESGYGLRGGKCAKCPPGTVSLYYKSTCTPCAKGTFSNRPGTIISCRTCPKNTFAGKSGSSRCKPCPAGTVSYGLGDAKCVRIRT